MLDAGLTENVFKVAAAAVASAAGTLVQRPPALPVQGQHLQVIAGLSSSQWQSQWQTVSRVCGRAWARQHSHRRMADGRTSSTACTAHAAL